jgi:hypothetical protein
MKAARVILWIGIGCVVAATDAADFEKEIRPLLEKRCVECHGAKKQKADLRLDLRAHAFKGGESGVVIVPGDSAKSPLFQRVISESDDERMPPRKGGGEPLSKDEVATLKAWIDAGAPWPESSAEKAAAVDARLQHWSLQPVKVVRDASSSVDFFIDEKLKTAGLVRSPEADPRTLIRRLSLDVIGLPPTPEEVEAFVAESIRNPQSAFPNLVERLLASPRFGERWARHWLDVVRFAESDGFETNRARENAWPYRDYVIRAFNDDRPYDRFICEQIAGDAFGEDAATGFLVGGGKDRVGSKDPVLTANQRADELHDIVSTTAATFLGLTLNCARCHDHKFDPIPAKDYYAFVAMFQGVQHGERPMRSADTVETEKRLTKLHSELAPLEAKLATYQPRAYPGRVMLIDDSDTSHTTAIEQPSNGQPVTYSPGREKGQADDPGDASRLPNLGESYRYWRAEAGKRTDFFTWEPKAEGRWRIWLSWGAWSTHAEDARYILDLDGDLKTTGDQTEITSINQRKFADGAAVAVSQKRWSGFHSAGVHELTDKSVVILRSGDKGGPTVADVIAFEEIPNPPTLQPSNPPATPAVPHLRSPVSHLANEDTFDAVEAKFVRFTITACSTGEPCIDELEVFNTAARNVARSAKVTVSDTYSDGKNPNHKVEHLNDGQYGNARSWISKQKGGGWAQLEFAKPERIQRIVWSRDRTPGNRKHYEDRLATGYRIEVSTDGANWTHLASSSDRLANSFRTRITSLPTLNEVPAGKAGEIAKLTQQRARLLDEIQKLSALPKVYAGTFAQPGPTHRNHRGDPTQPRETVAPGALSQIGKPLALPADAPEQERRATLANWIADPANPLTARVIVNRLWHYHFGTGLVDTPSDFGINGSRPTHPELLDFLANELVTHGWSLKHIHRLILLSQTYRQSSVAADGRRRADLERGMRNEERGKEDVASGNLSAIRNPQSAIESARLLPSAATIDSGSRLLWRFPPRRIEAETLRDAMLAVSGKLDLTMGGPGFDLFEPNDNYVKVYATKAEYGPAEFRRMVYQSKPRTMLDDFFGTFDCPDAGQPAPKRTSSTTPLQALNLLNSSFAMQLAGFLAERLNADAGENADAEVKRAFALMFNRAPSPGEITESTALIARHGLAAFCRALFNANEFIRLD